MVNAMPLSVNIVCVCLLGPLCEELLFRGLVAGRLARYGQAPGAFVSALLFALYHANLEQFFYAFLLGLLLAYVYYRTGLLRVSVALHMVLNFFGAVVSLLLPDCAASDMALGAFWMVSVVLGVILLVRGRKDQIWLHGPCAPDMRAVFGQRRHDTGHRGLLCRNRAHILIFEGSTAMRYCLQRNEGNLCVLICICTPDIRRTPTFRRR